MSAMRFVPSTPVRDDAEFSSDGAERLWLSRKVAESGPVGLIIGLNPSTAGATENDPTITKEMEFSRSWLWGGFWKANLFTRIETYSKNLKNMSFREAVGEHGSTVLLETIPLAHEIVVCWGAAVPKHMTHRISQVCTFIRTLKQSDARVLCFGTSKHGHPIHPLYLSYSTPMVEFELPPAPVSRR